MRWCFVLVALFLAGCQRLCSPENCDGCCTDTQECVGGTARLDCGVGGAACRSCRSSELCVAGLCEAAPVSDAGVDAGPPTCICTSSCCLPDGSCAPNNGIDACGPAKQFCGVCASDQRCEQGTCVSASCGGCLTPLGACQPGTTAAACGRDGDVCVACGTDQACVAGACVFTRCDANNCRFGCCQPDLRCETSIGPAACGLNGSPCATCTAAQQCIGGGCQ